jgi:hypothetical protein
MAKAKTIFGVLTKAAGSYILGDHKLVALQVSVLPVEVQATACPETSPVKFFETKEVAEEFLTQLRTEFANRSKG